MLAVYHALEFCLQIFYLDILYCRIDMKALFLLLLSGWCVKGIFSTQQEIEFFCISFSHDLLIIRAYTLEGFTEYLCKNAGHTDYLWTLLDTFG